MTPGKTNSGAGGVRFSLDELASGIGGRVEGDADREITGIAGLREAGPGDITVFFSSRYRRDLKSTRAGAIIVGEGGDFPGRTVLRAASPQLAFARALELFYPSRTPSPGIHPSAVIEQSASVDPSAVVSAFCHVGEEVSIGPRSVLLSHCIVGRRSVIGAGVLLHPRVTLVESVTVGDRVIIHSGTVIGSDGFGYVFDGGRHLKIPQVGGVEIGDDVEIGANVTIDRATTGTTRIGEGSKIDNLVQIAHNVDVGKHTVVVSQVGISGSSRVGSGVVLGGQVGVVGHVTIGDGARVGAQSGVINDVPPGETRSGMGPLPHRQWLKAQAAFDHLPDLRRRLRELEKKVRGEKR